MLETVAKPMLQMLEIQRESSAKRIQSLQTKLDQLSLGVSDECFCDGSAVVESDNGDDSDSDSVNDDDDDDDDVQENVPVPPTATTKQTEKKEQKSSMVSSSV